MTTRTDSTSYTATYTIHCYEEKPENKSFLNAITFSLAPWNSGLAIATALLRRKGNYPVPKNTLWMGTN